MRLYQSTKYSTPELLWNFDVPVTRLLLDKFPLLMRSHVSRGSRKYLPVRPSRIDPPGGAGTSEGESFSLLAAGVQTGCNLLCIYCPSVFLFFCWHGKFIFSWLCGFFHFLLPTPQVLLRYLLTTPRLGNNYVERSLVDSRNRILSRLPALDPFLPGSALRVVPRFSI